MKNILLTGGAGFIGSHTVEHILQSTDMTITIIDRLSYAGNLNRLTNMDCWESEKHRVKFIYHDFRSPITGYVLDTIKYYSPNYIIHMGAETHVENSFKRPLDFAETNVIGTINMLNLARELDIEKFVHVSTDEVYGPVIGKQLHKEGEPHRPSNPYSASKSGSEAFVHAYWKSFGVPVVITNTMNNFGERQDSEKFIPKAIKKIFNGETLSIHAAISNEGDITDISSRCWLHARNHADGLLFVMQNGIIGESYNIVGEHKNVYQVASMIAKFMNKQLNADFIPFHAYSPGHDMHYGLDGDKLKNMGWMPIIDLQESLKKTVDWTLNNQLWL